MNSNFKKALADLRLNFNGNKLSPEIQSQIFFFLRFLKPEEIVPFVADLRLQLYSGTFNTVEQPVIMGLIIKLENLEQIRLFDMRPMVHVNKYFNALEVSINDVDTYSWTVVTRGKRGK